MSRSLVVLFALGLAWPASGQGKDRLFRTAELEGGQTLTYALVLPTGFKPDSTYPVLLALPPGDQGRAAVERGLKLYWKDAAARGWVVVSPAAPAGRLFYQGSETLIPGLLKQVRQEVKAEGGKVHLAGPSNGGLSAFRIAVEYPQRFHSLIALPGYPPTPEDFDRLDRLAGLRVGLFVGEEDVRWLREMERTRERLKKLGVTVRFQAHPGEGHRLKWLTSRDLLDLLDRWRQHGR